MTKFQQQNVLPPQEDFAIIASYIQHKNIECVVKGDYLQAAKFEELSKNFALECQKYETKCAIEEEEKSVKEEIAQIKLQLDSLKSSYEHKIEREKARDSQVLQAMLDDQEKEMKEFNKYWSDPENLRTFCKGSATLISLRAKQKSLLLAKMFDEAEKIRKEADKLEEKETLDAQENIKVAVAKKREALEKKQLDELKRSRQYSVKIVEDLRTQLAKDEAQLNARLNKLKHDKNLIAQKDFAATRKGFTQTVMQRSETVPDGTRPPLSQKTPTQTSLSPRSRTMMENFKRSCKPKRLILKPLAPANVQPSRVPRRAFSK